MAGKLETLSLMADNDTDDGFSYQQREELEENKARHELRPWRRNRGFILLQICLIVLYTSVFWLLSSDNWGWVSKSRGSLVYSPAQTAVQLKKHRFDAELIIQSDYIGEPSPEVDLAWHNLLQNMNIAVPASDLDKIHTFSISVPDEPGMYVAGLSVFHELHCLKRLRQYTYLDAYFPNQTAEDARLNRLHTDHCIDVLRQAILCRADVSLFTLQWSEGQRMPRADFSHEHECVDWDVLNSWAAERSIPDEKMHRLNHPLYGSAFPDGVGSKLGASEDKSPTVHES